MQNNSTPTKRYARLTGLLYLLFAITAAFGLLYSPLVKGDAAATAQSILNNEDMFRLAIVSWLVSQVLYIWVALRFETLLSSVDKGLARIMVMFVVMAVTIAFANEAFKLGALSVLHGNFSLSADNPEAQNSLLMFLLHLHGKGISLAQVFWGLWLLPLGFLMYKSVFIPKWLGLLLMLGGVAYVVHSLFAFLWPQHLGIANLVLTPCEAIGEPVAVLWLLIVGVKKVA
jgi:hypothetical protein